MIIIFKVILKYLIKKGINNSIQVAFVIIV